MKTNFRIFNGDALEELPKLAAEGVKVDAVLTSPPYAMQRAKTYGGIPEADYPEWSVQWLAAGASLLAPAASVVINIREHVKRGEMTDYVLKTRLAIRAAGWIECDELIWFKPAAPPVGDPKRPRRSWERLLWYAPTRRPYCNPLANGKISDRIHDYGSMRNQLWAKGVRGKQDGELLSSGVARCSDVANFPVGNDGGSIHPAAFPVALARWLVRLFVPAGGTVLDPFAGSMTVGVACAAEGRNFIGVELKRDLFQKGEARLRRAHLEAVEAPKPNRELAPTPLFPEPEGFSE